jgi:hypothetical protein
MTPSNAKVIVAHPRHVASAKAADVASAEAADVASAKAADVASAEAADVASAEAAHVASATTTTTVSSATAAAAAGLRIRGNKAAGKQCTCQDHHHSSSHDILRLNGRHCPPQGFVRRWRVPERQTPRSRWTGDDDADFRFH